MTLLYPGGRYRSNVTPPLVIKSSADHRMRSALLILATLVAAASAAAAAEVDPVQFALFDSPTLKELPLSRSMIYSKPEGGCLPQRDPRAASRLLRCIDHGKEALGLLWTACIDSYNYTREVNYSSHVSPRAIRPAAFVRPNSTQGVKRAIRFAHA